MSAPLRVLLVGHFNRLAQRLDQSQWHRYQALARQPGVTLFGPGVEGYQPGMTVAAAVARLYRGQWPEVILHGMDFKESGMPLLEGLAEAPALTALELQDSWAVPDQQMAFINHQRFDLGLLIVRHHLPAYAANCPDTRFLWTPHAICTGTFHDYGLPKRYDVLLYGNLAEHTYPLRARLARLLSASSLRFRCIPHPGYYPTDDAAPEMIAGSTLARAINESWITIATSSVYRCVMMKYYEAAACRSLIAGDMPEEGREIFGANFLELDHRQSDSALLEAIQRQLADREELIAKTDAAHHRVLSEHSTDSFAQRLLQQFTMVLREREHSRQGT